MTREASFILSAGKLSDLPNDDIPEIALIGRSNAGKSTFLNLLAGQKKLAKVSSKPGCTQCINLFDFQINEETPLRIADLPGYGYAKFSKRKRLDLAKLVLDYFEQREQLKQVCLLSDIRRTFDETDIELRDFLFNCGKQIQIILTKADKVNQKEKHRFIKQNAELICLEPDDLVISSLKFDAKKYLANMNKIYT